jgi:hypothetical protein
MKYAKRSSATSRTQPFTTGSQRLRRHAFPERVGRPSRRAWASSSSSPGNARRWPISPHRGGDLRRPCRERPRQARRRARRAGPARSGRGEPRRRALLPSRPDGSSCSSSDRTSNRTVRWSTTSGASRACSRKSLASRPLRGWRRLVPSSSSSWPIATLSGAWAMCSRSAALEFFGPGDERGRWRSLTSA